MFVFAACTAFGQDTVLALSVEEMLLGRVKGFVVTPIPDYDGQQVRSLSPEEKRIRRKLKKLGFANSDAHEYI